MTDFAERYKALNKAQRQAVDTIDGPVMVIAGPGTGKTELMSMRVARILQQTDTLPSSILCLTYTDSGVSAMRERLVSIIGQVAYKVAIHTFHSFGTEIINQYREHFYRGAHFQPADELRQIEILQGIFNELPHDHILASTMNGQFTHLPDVQNVIADLKRSGLTSEQLLEILDDTDEDTEQLEKLLIPIFTDRMSKKTILAAEAALQPLANYGEARQDRYEIVPLAKVANTSLQLAVREASETGKTSALSIWKKQWFEKRDGIFQLKARYQVQKLRAASGIYFSYLSRMEQAGLYDFDDMVLQVVQALEKNEDLRYSLQEKYLYISVDEFQDTNLAQLRIIRSLTNNPAVEQQPNILVVGDDDQAIYSFQGADISNILQFVDHFPASTIITLTDNYRSKEPILHQSRQVITQGSNRLENTLENISKELTGHSGQDGSVSVYEALGIEDERQWLAQTIKQHIDSGVQPSDIAVFTRKHHELQSLLPYFSAAKVPVTYDYQDNALTSPPIVALLLLARVVTALAKRRHDVAEGLLPELLAHPAWNIAAEELWELSTLAFDQRKRWFSVMSEQQKWQPIHAWLVGLAKDSLHLPAELVIDKIIGRGESNQGPFYDYFFSPTALETQPADYTTFLNALIAIRQKLHEYSPQESLGLQQFIAFIELHNTLGRRIVVKAHSIEQNGVQLMTAHKSKGLEFPYVYIANATDATWGEKARSRSVTITYPQHMPLAPVGDSSDERLRLLYVALTRAKTSLTISFSQRDEKGKPQFIASFLAGVSPQPQPIVPPEQSTLQLEASENSWLQRISQPSAALADILSPVLQKYKLSPTHLSNFLDVTKGGPRQFLIERLLRFPATPSAGAAYGSAIHETMQSVHSHFNTSGALQPLEDILTVFETALQRERLTSEDFAKLLQKGHDHLRSFLESRRAYFANTQKPEITFAHQEVVVGDARLTGKIDVIDFNNSEKTALVIDYKTAKPAEAWTTGADYQRIHLHQYQQQLLFYKLLVEHSRDYSTYTVGRAQLEFIRPTPTGRIVAPLSAPIDMATVDRLKLLVTAVWQHIQAQDFPDTSGYEASLKGILAFEQDLIDGVI